MKCVILGKGSFHKIASQLMDLEEASCSRQSVFRRINGECVCCLSFLAYELVDNQLNAAEQEDKIAKITRIKQSS